MPRVDTDTFYRNSLATYGNNAEGVHWNSTQCQQVRFAAIRGFLPADLSALTLVDVGCGLGDLYGFLLGQGDLPGRYIGIDVVEPMVALARERTGCEILHRDVLSDPLPDGDYYLCSGAMNTLTREETEQFLRRCFDAAGRGLVFNLLKGKPRPGAFNHYLPEDLYPLAASLGVEPRFTDDYLHADFTMAFERRPARR
ncbi:MAG: class I SAM-dependent methyltransferase [Thiohalocapsa sp.]|jgi:SAM-dependent methyltransferase|nr:class I SAM-dependent methyltransferase [Thiohalocapsa sp.]MCF7991262.1 class I SAM-dependent methyltransferase [Thiohalocapsa sp.]